MFHPALDLHVHTTASDGKKSPADVVKTALELGLDAIAITDHDTVGGVEEAHRAAEGTPLFVVPGVELSIDFAGELHILGLFADAENEKFRQTMARLLHGRQSRARRIVEKLNDVGVPLLWDDVQKQAGGESVGRAHVAYALVQRGFVRDTDEAFAKYLERGKCAYVANERLSLDEALTLLKESGALSVWAHPMKTAQDQPTLRTLYEHMKTLGLGGMECFHPSAAPGESKMLERWCAQDGLLITGGSDWHDKPGGVPLGWPANVYDAEKYIPHLREHLAKKERFV